MQRPIGIEPKARIIYVGGDRDALASLTMSFAEDGVEVVSHEDALHAKQAADIGLIDLRGRTLSSRKAQSIAGVLRKISPESVILMIIDAYIDETARKALRRHGELVCVLTQSDALIERCRQILRLRNIAEEAGERLKTLATISRLNEFPPISAPAAPIRVLIASVAGPAALAALNALRPNTEQCNCVFSAGQALRAVESARFDAALFLPSRDTDPLLSLARSLRRHPKYASLPIIIATGDPDDAAEFAKRGASDFILNAHVPTDLAPKVQIAARRARLLKGMRRFLQACKGDGVRDSSSGAFTASFLSEHGARLCARADQSGRQIAITALSIETRSRTDGEPEPGKRALHQAARLINRVTRSEDIVARVASETFIVMMPATTEANAEKAGQRIRGVLENSVFRGGNGDLLYGIQVDIASCIRPAGLCIEESVALAMAVLRENASSRISEVR